MPPRSGAPPQITFCLEYPALNRPASNQLVSNRPASLPPPRRQVPGSERSKAPIRRIDEPANRRRPQFPTRAPPRSESHGACRPHPPRKAVRLEPSCFELFSLEPSRSQPLPGRQSPGSERSKAPIRRHDEPASFPRPSAPTRAPPRSESSGACRPHPPRKAVRREPFSLVLWFRLEPAAPSFILHAPSHTAVPFHSSRRTAASPSAGWPRAHPPP